MVTWLVEVGAGGRWGKRGRSRNHYKTLAPVKRQLCQKGQKISPFPACNVTFISSPLIPHDDAVFELRDQTGSWACSKAQQATSFITIGHVLVLVASSLSQALGVETIAGEERDQQRAPSLLLIY